MPGKSKSLGCEVKQNANIIGRELYFYLLSNFFFKLYIPCLKICIRKSKFVFLPYVWFTWKDAVRVCGCCEGTKPRKGIFRVEERERTQYLKALNSSDCLVSEHAGGQRWMKFNAL